MILTLAAGTIGYLAAEGDKTQDVRMLDILVVGPLMIFGSRNKIINLLGAATIGYNLRNYLAREPIFPSDLKASLIESLNSFR